MAPPAPAPAPAGVILYPKPAGVTSHDVVATVRRALCERFGSALQGSRRRLRVGHAGTLDPFATGLLLVLVGPATRAQRFLMELPKTYRALARLGWTSDTGDRDGRLTETGRVPERIELPEGEVWQRPPAYSAVRVGGERLYERARRGDPVEGEARRVVVHRAAVLWRDATRAEVELECSAGTYVRQIVAALGDAYCERLERTRIGPFRLEDADPERIVPLAEALSFLPERTLDSTEAKRAAHGAPVMASTRANGGGAVRLTSEGRLIAIAEATGDALRPTVVLAP
jgi:tRNA pseudouridine55 synthase